MRKSLLGAVAALAIAAGAPVHVTQAQVSDDAVKIGVIQDFSGLYADLVGNSSLLAVQLAVEDYGGKVLGKPISVVYADHQNKPDIASNVVRQWWDVDKLDMVTGVGTSSVALAVRAIAKEKGKIDINTGAASSDLSGKACSPTGFHWVYDTYALAKTTGVATVKAGGDTWFFLTADYAFGHALERDVTKFVTEGGGKVLGGVRHPLSTSDFSSFLLQAQASKAKIIGLANAGGDTINSIKQAAEFGIVAGGQKLAGLLVFATDIHALGLKTAQGLVLSESFYWDTDDETRKFSKRFAERRKKMPGGKELYPNMINAGEYGATLHYLKAVEAAGTDDPAKVAAKMREMPINDFYSKNVKIREDGRVMRPMYLYQVKAPGESKGPWDYYKLLQTVPGEQAFRPLAESECPLVKKG
jgi:branched-chain amino acid transport system substrate-binding protein